MAKALAPPEAIIHRKEPIPMASDCSGLMAPEHAARMLVAGDPDQQLTFKFVYVCDSDVSRSRTLVAAQKDPDTCVRVDL